MQSDVVNGQSSDWKIMGTPAVILLPLLFSVYNNVMSMEILMFADVELYKKVDSFDDMVRLQDDLNRVCS